MNENEEIKQAQRVYYREWRAKNRDKVKAINQRYWQRRAEKAKAERDSAAEKGGSENE